MPNPEIKNYEALSVALGNNEYTDVIIDSGQVVEPGSALGIITSTQKVKISASTSNDGSENVKYISKHHIDSSLADVPCRVISGGKVNENALKFGEGTDTLNTVVNKESYREQLRKYNIIPVPGVSNTYFDNQ